MTSRNAHEDDELHHRKIGRPLQTERTRDIGESKAEDGDADQPSQPGFDGGGGFRGQGERLVPGAELQRTFRSTLIAVRQKT